MPHMIRFASVLLAFLVVACAGPEYRWIKDGADQTSFQADRQACVEYVDHEFNPFYDYGPPHRRSSVSEEALFRQLAAEDMFKECMRKRGYQLVELPPKQ